jgi:hypothetical protein
MHWLDSSTLFVLAGAAAIGFVFGFLKPVIRLGMIALAMATAGFLAPIIIDAVNNTSNAGYPSYPLVSLLFVVSLAVYMTIFVVIRRQVWQAVPDLANTIAKLHWIDRLIGSAAAVVLALGGIALLLCLSHRVMPIEREMRYVGSRMYLETMTRVEPELKELPEWQKMPFRPMFAWLKRAGEKPVKTPATTPSTNTLPTGN